MFALNVTNWILTIQINVTKKNNIRSALNAVPVTIPGQIVKQQPKKCISCSGEHGTYVHEVPGEKGIDKHEKERNRKHHLR